jgi:hypothetical protein
MVAALAGDSTMRSFMTPPSQLKVKTNLCDYDRFSLQGLAWFDRLVSYRPYY